MTRRVVTIDNSQWTVTPAGRRTQYIKDEFALIFSHGAGPECEQRVVRYSPRETMDRVASLQRLSEHELLRLFRHSQPSWTSPELGYRR